MSVLIFFIILSVLVIVHELGHYLAARFFGVRVDEFGLGYPPKAKTLFRRWGTDFTLNWLPFGGFVKIFGEDYDDGSAAPADSLQSKNRGAQALILFAGVFFNFLFAWFLISIGLVNGLPAPMGGSFPVDNPQTVITVVVPGSPATEAGLKSGDALLALARDGQAIPKEGETLSPESAAAFISASAAPVTFTIRRGETVLEKIATPKVGILADRPAIGISMEVIGVAKLSLPKAVWEGGKITWFLTKSTAVALVGFIKEAVIGKADLSGVTGPVGLVGLVGDARVLGWSYLVSFAALISINLSIVNLLPFPALDGGRLFLVGLEAITRRKVPTRIFNAINTAGFAILIFLMILITVHDVRMIL